MNEMEAILWPDTTKPRYHFFDEVEQYRVKVQPFAHVPSEVTIQRISFEGDQRRYLHAAENGYSNVSSTRTRREETGSRSAESIDRSQRRAKTACRLAIIELAPSALVTYSTREVLTVDELLWVWDRYVRSVRKLGLGFEYVCVPELHPNGLPGHYHLHAAVRGGVSIDTTRRLWHIALEARHGRKVNCILRGALSPGNIDVQRVKGRDTVMRIRRTAKYLAKYITKDLVQRFNRKRYWPSAGIDVLAAKVYWLSSINQADAIREACVMLGHWEADLGPAFKCFRPSDRVCWYAVDADWDPIPPF